MPPPIHRSEERAVLVQFRVSREEREIIRQKARERNLSVQNYLQTLALELPEAPARRHDGPRPKHLQPSLPIKEADAHPKAS